MKNKALLLDCTLRDGGFLNDWNFGKDNIINIFERLVNANIDIIEVGFLDDRRPFNPDSTMMPDTKAANAIFGGLDKGNAMVVGMIDYGTCAIENLSPSNECCLDGIRIIFKKEKMHAAIDYCAQVKKLGYKVFAQAVSITSYNDEEMHELLDLVNELDPHAFSLVDTYGLLHKNQLIHYIELADAQLKSHIGIGYHSHNNFQLAYANCAEILQNPPANHDLIVDASLYGMGKSAGNAALELLAMFMNENMGKNYNMSQILEAIDVTILDISRTVQWGYSFKFYIAALNDCHPSYVTYLMDKKKLSVKSINEILQSMEKGKRLLYDKNYIEELYVAYQRDGCNDEHDLEELEKAFHERSILLLAPGNSIVQQKQLVSQYIEKEKPVVIAVNFLPDYKVDYIFISNAKRYVQLSARICELDPAIKIIATSNVTKTKGKFDYTLRYSDLLDEEAMIVDNPLIMLMRLFGVAGVRQVALAGFDGYLEAETPNYVNPNMEHEFTKEKAQEINQDTIKSLERLPIKVPTVFITPSFYQEK